MPLEPLSLHVAWVLLAAFLVAVMQAGFTCLESGFVRAKNSINVAIKNLIDFCISSLLFTLFGYSLMFGPSHGGWIGDFSLAHYDAMDARESAFFLFELMFCGTAATIISGAVSERMRFVGYVIVTVVIAGVIYPIAGHWAWNGLQFGQTTGWLAALGFMDFAGSTVVHSVGGWISLAAIVVVGPRIGRFGEGGHRIEGHNLPMSVLGVFLLWFGFFGFNGGSTLAFDKTVPLIVANTALAGAAGGLGGMLLDWAILRHPSVGGIVNGTVAGLVAICAGCNVIGEGAAIVGDRDRGRYVGPGAAEDRRRDRRGAGPSDGRHLGNRCSGAVRRRERASGRWADGAVGCATDGHRRDRAVLAAAQLRPV